MTESIVVIGSHQYRYSYNPDTGKTEYRGPVGSAPELKEEQFMAIMDIQAAYKELSTPQKEALLKISTWRKDAVLKSFGTDDKQSFNIKTLRILLLHELIDFEVEDRTYRAGSGMSGQRYSVWRGGITPKGEQVINLIKEREPGLKGRGLRDK